MVGLGRRRRMRRTRSPPARSRKPIVRRVTKRPPGRRSVRALAYVLRRPQCNHAGTRNDHGSVSPERQRARSPFFGCRARGLPGFSCLRTMTSPRLEAIATDGLHTDGHDVVVAPLLALDPDIAADLTPALREQVRGWLVVRVISLPRGVWSVPTER